MHKHRSRRNERSKSRERNKGRSTRRRSRSRSWDRNKSQQENNIKRRKRSPEEKTRMYGRPARRTERDRTRIKNEPVAIKQEPESPTHENNPSQPKEKPNFGLSGTLAEDTNIYNGIVIKYNEPSEARKPKRRWRLYPFKGEESLPMLPIHRQSAYLLGRERKVADIPIDHPSCSKQHAVLQFRLVNYERDDGTVGQRVRPYIIDLESSNGTYVNNNQIEPKRYYELFEKDVMKFGFSTREYVILHEESKDDILDDNVIEEENTEGNTEGNTEEPTAAN